MQIYELISQLRKRFVKKIRKNFSLSYKHLIMSTLVDIKKLREQLGLTQEELAVKIGVSIRTVQNWESGGKIPESTLRLLQLISEDETVSSPDQQNGGEPKSHNVTVGGNARNISNGTNEKAVILALTEISELRKLMAELIHINKEQSQRLINVIDKLTER